MESGNENPAWNREECLLPEAGEDYEGSERRFWRP
jgi:hypothetical protein